MLFLLFVDLVLFVCGVYLLLFICCLLAGVCLFTCSVCPSSPSLWLGPTPRSEASWRAQRPPPAAPPPAEHLGVTMVTDPCFFSDPGLNSASQVSLSSTHLAEDEELVGGQRQRDEGPD